MRGGTFALLNDEFRGFDNRHPAGGDRARTASAVAGMHDIAVALFEFYVVERDTELR